MITVRPADPSDCDQVAAIDQSGPFRLGRDLLLKYLGDPYIFLVAEADGRLEGFIIGILAADELQLVNIVVSPTARRSGIGSSLIKTISRISVGQGASQFVLEVAESNIAAINFYISLGFRKTGRRREFYSSGEDAFIMSVSTSLIVED